MRKEKKNGTALPVWATEEEDRSGFSHVTEAAFKSTEDPSQKLPLPVEENVFASTAALDAAAAAGSTRP
jgi:hypothetical protein